MVNFAEALKAEIVRISRKEVKTGIREIRKSSIRLKKVAGELKKRVASLEGDNRRLMETEKAHTKDLLQEPGEEAKKVRITSQGIRRIRNRCRLTSSDFARLLGTTPQSVRAWEGQSGVVKLRGPSKAAILSIRGMGAREARARLAEAEAKDNSSKALAKKRRP